MEIIILVVLGGLSWLANLSMDRLLKRRLRSFQDESVHMIPGFFRQPLLLVVLVLIPLEFILPIAWFIRPVNGIGTGIGLVLPALLLPLLAFALVMLWIHYGAVVLTPESVRRYTLFGYHEIPYRDIREVEQKLFFLTPVTVVSGCGEMLRFPRQIQDHPQLVMALRDIRKANLESLGVQSATKEQRVEFPYSFGISPRRLMWEKIAFALLLLIFAVLSTLGIWIQLAQDMLPPFTLESFFLIGLFFIPFGIIFPILVIVAYRQTIRPDKPTRFVLYEERIDVFFPHHRQECYAVSDLNSVRLNPIQSVVKGEFDGVTVTDQAIHYELILQFSGEKEFSLTPNRLALFGKSPELLRSVFRELYDL